MNNDNGNSIIAKILKDNHPKFLSVNDIYMLVPKYSNMSKITVSNRLQIWRIKNLINFSQSTNCVKFKYTYQYCDKLDKFIY